VVGGDNAARADAFFICIAAWAAANESTSTYFLLPLYLLFLLTLLARPLGLNAQFFEVILLKLVIYHVLCASGVLSCSTIC
jgi:hypothetical protein